VVAIAARIEQQPGEVAEGGDDDGDEQDA